MFRAKGGVKSLVGRKNLLGEKDRKDLRKQYIAQFGGDVGVVNELVCPGNLYLLTLKASSVEIYFNDDTPIFFKKRKEKLLLPTLFTLWKCPNLLPTITVKSDTPRYLIKGADLMYPGCIPPPNGLASTGIDIDHIYAVVCNGNPVPFALGQCLMSNHEIATSDKGKLLQIHHVLGDLLFTYVTDPELPPGFTPTTCKPLDAEGASEPHQPSEHDDSDHQNDGTGKASADGTESHPEKSRASSIASIDDDWIAVEREPIPPAETGDHQKANDNAKKVDGEKKIDDGSAEEEPSGNHVPCEVVVEAFPPLSGPSASAEAPKLEVKPVKTAEEKAEKKKKESKELPSDARIQVSIMKTKRFTRTRVAGFHLFPNIEAKALATKLQKVCASAASVGELEEWKSKGGAKPPGVFVQGSHVQEIRKVLEKDFGVPANRIQS